jgi:hypothetical protein
MTIRRKMATVLATWIAAIATPALADDLLLSKSDATDLIESDIGKPYWQMEAQCAGMFGAAYAYHMDRHAKAEAERARDAGIAMLNEAVARLELDRGVDQPTALNLAAEEVETGRASAKVGLERQGAGPQSYFNFMRSACFDISDAQRRHTGSRR